MIRLNYPKIKNITLFLYFFSMPFLYWDPIGVRSSFTVTAFAFLIYMLVISVRLTDNLHFKSFAAPGLALLLLWLLLLLHSVYGMSGFYVETSINASFLQIIIMMFLLQSHLYIDDKAYSYIYMAVGASCALTAVLISLGIGLQASYGDEYYGGRLYFFGMNPNSLGNIAAFSLVFSALFGLDSERKLSNLRKLFVMLAVSCSLFILAFTASRGAVIASALPVMVLLMLSNVKTHNKILIVSMAVLLLSTLLLYLVDMSLLIERFTANPNVESLGGRTRRWEAAFDIFSNSPFIGVGVGGYNLLTASEYGFTGSPHNSFLQVMAYGGVLGLILFLIPILVGANLALKSYRLRNRTAPLALLLFYVLLMSKDGGALNSAFNWSILALSMGLSLNLLSQKKVVS